MQYTWFKNREPTSYEKIILVVKTFLICFVIPLIIANKFILGEVQAGEVGLCTLGMILMFLFSILLSLGLLEQLRPLDRVGISYDNIKLTFRGWPERTVEWEQVHSITQVNRSDKRDYQIFVNQENSELLSYYLVTEEIASTLKKHMIEMGYRFNHSGKIEIIGDAQVGRFCPGCGRKNDDWIFCPDCGRRWN